MIVPRIEWLRTRLLGIAGVLVLSCALFRSQSMAQMKTGAADSLHFEVASIKVSNPSGLRPGRLGSVQVDTTPGRLTARNAYLKELIKGAYGLEDYQVLGGPAWIASAKFDVEATSNVGVNRDRQLQMLRTLLAERFKLISHRETKEFAIYALTVAKGGPKFQALTGSKVSCWPACADSPSRVNTMRIKDLPSFANFLTRLDSDRPVIDKTGLAGNFALELDMQRIFDEAIESGATLTNGMIFEGLVNSIEAKLGLKLVPTKARLEILVVDHAEKPSEN